MDQKREIFEMTRALERRLLQQRSKAQNQKDPLPSFLVGVHPFHEARTNRPVTDHSHPDNKRYVFLMSKSSLVLLSIFLLVLALVCFLGGFMVSKVLKDDAPKTTDGLVLKTPTPSKLEVVKDMLDVHHTLEHEAPKNHSATHQAPPKPDTQKLTPTPLQHHDDTIPPAARSILYVDPRNGDAVKNLPLDSQVYDLDFYGKEVDQTRHYLESERNTWRDQTYEPLDKSINPSPINQKPLYTIELGAFEREGDAKTLALTYRQKGYEAFVAPQHTLRGLLYVVQMGGFSTHLEANQQALAFIQKEQRQARVVKGA